MSVISGQTILITGAAGGFGRAMTRQFLQAGGFLVLSDQTLPAIHAAAAATAHQLKGCFVPGRILGYVAADLATREGCAALYRQVCVLTPQIDMLVNNAGIGGSGHFSAVPAEVWERMLAVNLLAPMRLTELFLPAMLARRSGHIVNVASVAGLIGAAGLAPYSTTKFGLRGFSEALAAEAAPFGVGVTALFPFFTRTPILNSAHFGADARATLPNWLIGEPEQVIAALIAGIEANQRTVIPGSIAQTIDVLQRLAPGALHTFSRLLAPDGRGKADRERPQMPECLQ